ARRLSTFSECDFDDPVDTSFPWVKVAVEPAPGAKVVRFDRAADRLLDGVETRPAARHPPPPGGMMHNMHAMAARGEKGAALPLHVPPRAQGVVLHDGSRRSVPRDTPPPARSGRPGVGPTVPPEAAGRFVQAGWRHGGR